jgi:nitrogen fixation/metabolism regulation signal transduction histidine kinase
MKSTFGGRLLRLLLAFSLAPTFLMALLGLYLASETANIVSPALGNGYSTLAEAQRDDQFRRLNRALVHFPEADLSIDILVERGPDSLVHFSDRELLSEAAWTTLFDAVPEQTQGFLQCDDRLVQYVCQPAGDGTFWCAGFVVHPDVSRALQSAQNGPGDAAPRRDVLERYLPFLSVLLLVVVLGTIGAAYYLSGRIARGMARPLEELSAASTAIAAGKFDHRVTAQATGEIANLIVTFNRMAEQLSNLTVRLSQAERVAAWRHVARRFAHELKNPLQPITISLHRIEKLLSGSGHFEIVSEPMRAIKEEIHQLTKLADRFSQLAKLPEPTLQPTDVGELAGSVAALYREQLSAFTFDLQLPKGSVTANVDPTYFREALHNLLQNAMDASEPGGSIVLGVHELGAEEVAIAVQDHGQGMSVDTIRTARLPYFTTKTHGTGLGLAIVEKVVTECGGRLNIESESGRGTLVTIALPRRNTPRV